MKNIINYFYNLNITKLTNKDNIYSFYDNDELYHFYIYNNNIKNLDLTKDIDDSLKKEAETIFANIGLLCVDVMVLVNKKWRIVKWLKIIWLQSNKYMWTMRLGWFMDLS